MRWDKDRWVMAWEDDLIADIHYGDERDGIDLPLLPDLDFGMAKLAMHLGLSVPMFGSVASVELSDSNRANLLLSFLSIRDSCKLIVEIGVDRINGGQSSTRLFLDIKKP